MNLIEQVEKILADRNKKQAAAMGKLRVILSEVEKLAKRTGYLETLYDVFSYYVPTKSRRDQLLFRVYVSGGSLHLVTVQGKEQTVTTVTYETTDAILMRLSNLIADRLSKEGIYLV